MFGAILGDMIGSPYEFDRSPKTKEFPLFKKSSTWTDDSVMTVAVAEALLQVRRWMEETGGVMPEDEAVRALLVKSLKKYGRTWPDAGYGGRFRVWLFTDMTEPYGSYGNGSAMRVSSAGWLFETLEETRHIARLTADVTHDHPEGIKGAESVAAAIWLARHGSGKEEIREYVTREFGYDLSRTCDQIRPGYRFNESCQGTVPEAFAAFLEGEDFEDVIRGAVSLGGDCDTLTCIAGGIAEACYGIPKEIAKEGKNRLTEDMLSVLNRFDGLVNGRTD